MSFEVIDEKDLIKLGSIVHVVVYHKIDNFIEHYVEKFRICGYLKGAMHDYYYVDKNFDDGVPLSNLFREKRIFRPHRIFKTYEDAEMYANFKNEENKLKRKYAKDIRNLKGMFYE